jgi:para-aminobenzoate synthetase component 1
MSYEKISLLASRSTPFLFITDFKGERIEVFTLDELENSDIEFSLDDSTTASKIKNKLSISPISFDEYRVKFDQVIEKIKDGYTYILNLTQPTPLQERLELKEIFKSANAKFKLRYKDEFFFLYPERLIKIYDYYIYKYKIKGNI